MNDALGTLVEKLEKAPFLQTVHPLSSEILCTFARCLHAEGYPALEILCRPAEEALPVFQAICTRPERELIFIGLGTLRTEAVAKQAAELRPDFLVSPAFSRKVLGVAAEAGIPYIPAVRTFQDTQDVLDAFDEAGQELRLLKLCPCDGLPEGYVSMLSGCFPGYLFLPSGWVTPENYVYWKRQQGVIAPLGSQFVPPEVLVTQHEGKIRGYLRMYRELAESAV